MESTSLWDALACLRADFAKLISPTRSENALGPHCTASALLSRRPQWHQEESTSTKQAGAKSSTCTHGPPTRAARIPPPFAQCPRCGKAWGEGRARRGFRSAVLSAEVQWQEMLDTTEHLEATPHPPTSHSPLPPFPIPHPRFCRRATHFSVFRKRAARCCVHERLRAI